MTFKKIVTIIVKMVDFYTSTIFVASPSQKTNKFRGVYQMGMREMLQKSQRFGQKSFKKLPVQLKINKFCKV